MSSTELGGLGLGEGTRGASEGTAVSLVAPDSLGELLGQEPPCVGGIQLLGWQVLSPLSASAAPLPLPLPPGGCPAEPCTLPDHIPAVL